MNFLAIDYGTKKTWLAYSIDGFVFPWKTVPTKLLKEYIINYIAEKKIDSVIVWMPYNIDGTLSNHANNVQLFMNNLSINVNIPIIGHDERCSTSEADIWMDTNHIEESSSDHIAACIILEDYIKENPKK